MATKREIKDAPASLARYQQKRDFTQTAEPSGRLPVARSGQLRFVIQKHAASHLHYDLRLELDGVFKSWAVTKGPSLDPATKRLAVEVEDHPLDYGDFEGTIPKGQYGGGTVQLWDRGYWTPANGRSPQDALSSGDLKFTLQGKRLQGSWVLVRIKNDRLGNKRTNWLLIKHRDEFAKPGQAEGIPDSDASVASGRSMEQIAAGKGKAPSPFMLAKDSVKSDAVWRSNREDKNQSVLQPVAALKAVKREPQPKPPTLKTIPSFIEPQLCMLVERPPSTPGWAHEVKFDGYRAQLRVQNGVASVRTRSGLDWTHQFAAIAHQAEGLSDCIIDGEVCALDQEQMPSFAALQTALSEDRSENLVFFAFDLLVEGRQDLRALSLADRKARLEALLQKADAGNSIRYVSHFESTADTVLLSACKMHLERHRIEASRRAVRVWPLGRLDQGEVPRRTRSRAGGWTTEAGGLRSLLAGVNRDGHLVYVGRIGTGYAADVASKLLPTLQKLTVETSPFGGANAPRIEKNIRWLKPTLVAEIEFAGWTATGMIRQAAFKGLRRDKPASEVVAEVPSPVESSTDVPDEKLAAKVKSASRKTAVKRSATKAAPSPAQQKGVATVMGVTLSKPDKALWPDAGDGKPVTKFDLANYYEAVGEWLLPHLKGRPCSLVRAPDGMGGETFFQRHAMAGISNLFSLVKVKGDKRPTCKSIG